MRKLTTVVLAALLAPANAALAEEAPAGETPAEEAPAEEAPAEEAPAEAAAAEAAAAEEVPAEGAPDGRARALLMDLAANGVDEATVRTVNSLVAVELSRYDELDLLTGDDMRRSLELEATREAMGCDDTSCLAELADALGAQIVVYGDIGKLGDLVLINLSLFDNASMKSLGRVSIQVEDLGELPTLLRPQVRELLTPFYESRGLTPPGAEATESGSALGVLPWVVVGGGVVVAAVGGGLVAFGTLPWAQFSTAEGDLADLQSDLETDDDPDEVRAEAAALHDERERHRQAWESWGGLSVVSGGALIAVGVLVAAGGVAWALVGGGE